MKIKITNADVMVWEPHCHCKRMDIVINEGLIESISSNESGRSADTRSNEQFTDYKIINGNGKLVIPGLVNCHTHAYMSAFRNFADDLQFDEWLFKKILPAEDLLTPEDAYWCNLLSCLEMIKTGTTCFADMHMFKGQSVRAAKESGLRAVISRGLVGKSTEDPAAKIRLAETFEEMKMAEGSSRIGFMLGPHAIYSCGEDMLRSLPALAKEKKLGLMIHISESKHEFETCMHEHGSTPVSWLDSIGFFTVPVLAAHCVHLIDEDIKILARRKVSVVTNPVSNMKLGNGFAPVSKLLNAGINLCTGTDGASSNNSLNLFRELSIMSYIHKGLDKNALSLPADQTLKCGILNGAKALGLEDKTGSIQPGKKADIVLIDLNKPWLQPVNNPVSALVYSANGSEADTVIIDGKIIMEKGIVNTLDEERIYFEVDKIKNKLRGKL